MDCNTIISGHTLVKLVSTTNADTHCSAMVLADADLGSTSALSCDETELSLLDLFYRAYSEGNGALIRSNVDGSPDDVVPLSCDQVTEGLESLVRRTLLIAESGVKIKTFSSGGSAVCMACDEPMSFVPLIDKIMGSIVTVAGEYRFRTEPLILGYPQQANHDCDGTDVSIEQILSGALSYDNSNGTWFWNTTTI